MNKYLSRLVDDELNLRLQSVGAVLIVGPKWSGKTTSAEQKAKSVIRFQDPDYRAGYIETAKVKPSLLLAGENPRLIDEWQDIPEIWDSVRTLCDRRKKDGLFILTGSTSVDNDKILHTGTGRISRLKMYPMSLYESEESNGKISLKSLFNKPNLDIDGVTSDFSIEQLIFASCRGGWPGSLFKKSDNAKLFIANDYFENVCQNDISSVDGVMRNPEKTALLLKSYARNISTVAKTTSILKDVNSKFENMGIDTLNSYINALEKLFIIEELEAWCPSIRSASAIRSGKKREFIDPSIACASLGLTPEYFYKDLKTFGFIFETLCIRDLKIYSQSLGGKVSYYRDRYGLEADAVLYLRNGKYALIEFKLGSVEIENGAEHLLKIKDLIKEYNKKETQCPLHEPDLLMIITGGNIAYTRKDGVKVIPISTLKN